MTKTGEKLVIWILNLVLSIVILICEFIDYVKYEETLSFGTTMWVTLSLYLLIKSLEERGL